MERWIPRERLEQWVFACWIPRCIQGYSERVILRYRKLSLISDTQRRRLQVVQNRIMRGVLSEGRYARIQDLYANTGVELMSDHINLISEKFYSYGVPRILPLISHRVRFDPDHPATQGPPYKRLPIYLRDPQPPLLPLNSAIHFSLKISCIRSTETYKEIRQSTNIFKYHK